ncbi:hypothetical protein SAMN05216410_0727 [Sanguibacter gelidistatuariae]|uniref:PIN domain-containing protein n=1 Tax=Sanguibacter gelidistatuariae TaxID=1814289 RepID=A0A1G6H4F9_9MICO|nr:hypothetical protein [Sanguibacter gelidistatuariae]SDB89190.1 hypothetical protein SAMN05216410_0727 [Sanguibacter gelidistatuariae]
MTRFVVGPDVALHLAREELVISSAHQLLAPTLIRSQVLTRLYSAVRRGELDRKDAEHQLDNVRGMRMRLLGDRVLQRVAWDIAVELDWPDTLTAEYLALTCLQADAFITLDAELAATARRVVAVASVADLF